MVAGRCVLVMRTPLKTQVGLQTDLFHVKPSVQVEFLIVHVER